MRTVGFINWKGGVGKTCIAINTAYALSEGWGAKILFIDMDKQANASYWFRKDENVGTLGNILAQGIDAEEVANIKAMTAEEQDACLEKILTGEIKGTIQDIQAQKSTEVNNAVEENSAEVSENDSLADDNEEKSETESASTVKKI